MQLSAKSRIPDSTQSGLLVKKNSSVFALVSVIIVGFVIIWSM